MTMDEEFNLDEILKERLAALPKAIRDAIASADIEQNLQQVSERHKLHMDTWDALENEVMLALIGLEPMEKLQENIASATGVTPEEASAIADDISETVFEPIREEIEDELAQEGEGAGAVAEVAARPERSVEIPAPPAPASDTGSEALTEPAVELLEQTRELSEFRGEEAEQTPAQAQNLTDSSQPIASSSVPPEEPAPEKKSVRAPISTTYAPNVKSHARPSPDGDPYREQIQ